VTAVALLAVLDIVIVIVIVSCKSKYKEMQYVSCLHLGSIFFFIPKLNVFSKNLLSKVSI
jgi:hypothetical protein